MTHAMAAAGQERAYGSYDEHVAAGVRAFLDTLADHRNSAQTLLVEIIGAGPRAAARRDAILEAFADGLHRDNARTRRARRADFASADDAFAVIGAAVELVSRQLRTGRPDHLRALEPVIDRLVIGPLDRDGP